jgi:hypothetical protein
MTFWQLPHSVQAAIVSGAVALILAVVNTVANLRLAYKKRDWELEIETHKGNLKRELQLAKSELDRELQILKDSLDAAREASQAQLNKHLEKELQVNKGKLDAAREESLARLKQELEEELREKAIPLAVKEINAKRIQASVKALKDEGFAPTMAVFESLAAHCHVMDDQALFQEFAEALASHQLYHRHLSTLHHEIPEADYIVLRTLHIFLTEVILDVARTKDERTRKQEQMRRHLGRIRQESEVCGAIFSRYLRADS